MTSRLRVAVVSRDPAVSSQIVLWIEAKGLQAIPLSEPAEVLEFFYGDPPDIAIVDLHAGDREMQELIRHLKADSYFSMLPLIGIIEKAAAVNVDWREHPLDDFITVPVSHTELISRIHLALQRIQRVLDNNPLTRLPGNTSIQKAIERTLGTDNAVCYIDINDFKSYNDTYGFSRVMR